MCRCAAAVPRYGTGSVSASVYMHVMCIIRECILGYQVSIQF